jgi:hypothetical protein
VRSAPLVALPAWSVVFGWARPFVIISIFSICESVCYFHQFWHRFRLCSSQFFNEIRPMETGYKGIYCSLVGDVFCWVFLLYSIVVCMNCNTSLFVDLIETLDKCFILGELKTLLCCELEW